MKKLIIIICLLFIAVCADAKTFNKWDGSGWTVVTPYRWDGATWQEAEYNKYHVFIVAGQSNAVGYNGETANTLSAPNAIEIHPDGTYEKGVNDPVGMLYDNTWGIAIGGSAWPSFALEYYTLTGHIPIIMSIGQGATSLRGDWMDPAGKYLYSESVISVQVALDLIDATPTFANRVTFKGFIWWQGETQESDDSIANYTTALEAMQDGWISNFQSRQSDPLNFYYILVHTGGTYSTPAETAVAASRSDSHVVCDAADGSGTTYPTHDGLHHTQDAYDDIGEAVANAIAGE